MKNKGNLIVISGPSGTGKGTVCKELLKAQPEIVFSILISQIEIYENEFLICSSSYIIIAYFVLNTFLPS